MNHCSDYITPILPEVKQVNLPDWGYIITANCIVSDIITDNGDTIRRYLRFPTCAYPRQAWIDIILTAYPKAENTILVKDLFQYPCGALSALIYYDKHSILIDTQSFPHHNFIYYTRSLSAALYIYMHQYSILDYPRGYPR